MQLQAGVGLARLFFEDFDFVPWPKKGARHRPPAWRRPSRGAAPCWFWARWSTAVAPEWARAARCARAARRSPAAASACPRPTCCGVPLGSPPATTCADSSKHAEVTGFSCLANEVCPTHRSQVGCPCLRDVPEHASPVLATRPSLILGSPIEAHLGMWLPSCCCAAGSGAVAARAPSRCSAVRSRLLHTAAAPNCCSSDAPRCSSSEGFRPLPPSAAVSHASVAAAAAALAAPPGACCCCRRS